VKSALPPVLDKDQCSAPGRGERNRSRHFYKGAHSVEKGGGIVDIIHHRNKDSTQQMLVLNRYPIFLYERVGQYLIAEDEGFFHFYGYGACSPGWKAFGGREFDIPMRDGSIVKAVGQWWDAIPKDYYGLLTYPGIATVEQLNKCNVFHGGYVDPVLVENWLAAFTPSNNYDKYCKGHANYGKDTIISKWEI